MTHSVDEDATVKTEPHPRARAAKLYCSLVYSERCTVSDILR